MYGHKDIYMIVCFLAAVKSGRAYCPLDISIPTVVLKVHQSRAAVFDLRSGRYLRGSRQCCFSGRYHFYNSGMEEAIDESFWVKGEDIFYIIFTSGSTGTPKGVQITANNLNHYLEWSTGLELL